LRRVDGAVVQFAGGVDELIGGALVGEEGAAETDHLTSLRVSSNVAD